MDSAKSSKVEGDDEECNDLLICSICGSEVERLFYDKCRFCSSTSSKELKQARAKAKSTVKNNKRWSAGY